MDPQVEIEGSDKLDLVDYKVDPYEEALRIYNLLDGGDDTFFHLERHSCSSNILHEEVCSLFTWLYHYSLVVFFWSILLLLSLCISVVFLIWLILMIGTVHY